MVGKVGLKKVSGLLNHPLSHLNNEKGNRFLSRKSNRLSPAWDHNPYSLVYCIEFLFVYPVFDLFPHTGSDCVCVERLSTSQTLGIVFLLLYLSPSFYELSQ